MGPVLTCLRRVEGGVGRGHRVCYGPCADAPIPLVVPWDDVPWHAHPSGVAQAPVANGSLGEFASAAVWALQLSPLPNAAPLGDWGSFDVRIRVNYTGDCARA